MIYVHNICDLHWDPSQRNGGIVLREKQAQFSYLGYLRMSGMALILMSNDYLFLLNVHDFTPGKPTIYLYLGIYPP